jgi:hypothetical protein
MSVTDDTLGVPAKDSVPAVQTTGNDQNGAKRFAETEVKNRHELAVLRAQNRDANLGRILWAITLISGGISFFVVMSVVGIAIGSIWKADLKIPDALVNWGGIILGFYFGQFVNLVKDYSGVPGPQGEVVLPNQPH